MSIIETANLAEPQPHRRFTRRRLMLGICLLAVGFGLYVAYVPQPRIALGVLTATEQEDGGTLTSGELSSQPKLAAQATAVHSNVNSSTSSSTAISDGTTWPRSSVAIFCESDHLLTQRVGLELFEGLQQGPEFERVQYIPRGKSLPAGQEVPDVLIVIDMPTLKESGVPVAAEYMAEFTATIGREFAHGSTYTISNSTPPVMQFQAEIQMDYAAKQTGVETSGARYATVSRDIAKHLRTAILNFLSKGDRPSLPPRDDILEYYPEFQAPPALVALQTLQATPKLQGPRFMQATSAAWTFRSVLAAEELRALFDKELPAPEWRYAEREATDRGFSATWQRGAERWAVLLRKSLNRAATESDADTPADAEYVVMYKRGMSDDETLAAFRAVLEREPSETVLLPFVQQWHHERERLERFFAEHPPGHVDSIQVLADWEIQSGNVDSAREWILRGYSLDRLLFNGERRSQFEQLAKKLGLEKLPERLDPEVIGTLGLLDFRTAPELTLKVQAGSRPMIWLASSEDEQSVLKLIVVRQRNGGWQLGHEVSQVQQHGHSRSTTGPHAIDPAQALPRTISNLGETISITPHATENPATIELRLTRPGR